MKTYWGMKEVLWWEEITWSNFLTEVNGLEHIKHKKGPSLAHTWILHKWRHSCLGVVSKHATRRKPSFSLWQHTNVPATIKCHKGMDNREHRYRILGKRSLIFHQPSCNQTTCQLSQQLYIGPDCYQFLIQVPENECVTDKTARTLNRRVQGHW